MFTPTKLVVLVVKQIARSERRAKRNILTGALFGWIMLPSDQLRHFESIMCLVRLFCAQWLEA